MPEIIVTFTGHKFHILETGDSDFYISINRKLRITPFEGMKQPCPVGGFLGYDVVLKVDYQGQPANGFYYTLYGKGISHGRLSIDGIASGLDVLVDEKCQCIPYDWVLNEKTNCDSCEYFYKLAVYDDPEGFSLAKEES